jgi:hypothetical protein
LTRRALFIHGFTPQLVVTTPLDDRIGRFLRFRGARRF